MGFRTTAAQALSAVSSATLKHVFRRPAGNFPGKIALYADPRIIAEQAAKLKSGSISVVGTNGKTTVTNLVADCLEAQGMRVVCNRTGANLDSGIATSLLESKEADWGVFETDEMWLARTLPQLQSRYVILLNLFRDQLDRVGEVDRIEDSIVAALETSPETVLVYNADDPCCEVIARRVSNPTIPFGIGEDLHLPIDPTNDARMCQLCESMVEYEYRHYNQLGNYQCPQCGFARSPLRFAARNCHVDAKGMDFDIVAAVDEGGVAGGALTRLKADYTGTYMIYNLLASYIGAHLAGANNATIQSTVATYHPSNGRLEKLEVQGKSVLLNLAKNPTGFNQNIALMGRDENPKAVAFFVNDYEGDGRDVSWLWDIDFEQLSAMAAQAPMKVFAGGLRRNDVQLRLKYAGVSAELVDNALDCMSRIQALPDETHVYMIANYTSLPAVREDMEKLAAGKAPITAPPLRVSAPVVPSDKTILGDKTDIAIGMTSAVGGLTSAETARETSKQAADLAALYALIPNDQPLRIVHVLPDLLNMYGDAGNVTILKQRCAWRGISVQVDQVNFGQELDLSRADIVCIGTGPEREQKLAAEYLMRAHDALSAYIEDGGVVLAVSGGFQLLGKSWPMSTGEVEGLGILDITTTRHEGEDERFVGDIVLESELSSLPIVGYENHVGNTVLGEQVQPFGTVHDKLGIGNNVDDNEDGAHVRNMIATYAHGPLLSKNPEVADWLIAQSIHRRTGQTCQLPPLDDAVEMAAHRYMCDRLGVH